MAKSKCPNQNCPNIKEDKNTLFELKESNFKSKFTYYFVQCSTCGTVIGVIDQYSHKSILDSINNIPDYSLDISLLQNSDHFDKIMTELIGQSEAIKAIMKQLKIDF